MRAVVLGACGAVGREVAAGLVARGAFERIDLADRDRSRLEATSGRLQGRGVTVTRQALDARDERALGVLFGEADLVLNCTSYNFGLSVLGAAIEAGIDYLDLGGLYNTPRQLELDHRARAAGVRAVIGCGATPGLSNMLVGRAARRLDAVREVHISFASHRDLAPSPGLLDTLLDEFRPGVPRFTWRAGRLSEVRPFDGPRLVRFSPPLGRQRVYFVPHSETYTVPRFLDGGARDVSVRGTWRPEHMQLLEGLSRIGLTRDEPVEVGGISVRPCDVLRAVLLDRPPREAGICAFFLHVEVIGRRAGRPITVVQRASHPLAWGTSATGRMTAVPAIVGAEMIGRGQVYGSGVQPPEASFDPERFVSAVRALGVKVTTSTTQGSVPYKRSPKSPSPGRM